MPRLPGKDVREKGNFGLGECIHPKCGCTRFKPGWATEHCPIGEW